MTIAVHTDKAPAAIGCYSQAIKVDKTVYFSGQIPIDPATQSVVVGDVRAQVTQIFENMSAVAKAAGGDLSAIIKLGVYLVDLADFPVLNEVMAKYFQQPYPARTTVQVSALPKNVAVEVDAIMILKS